MDDAARQQLFQQGGVLTRLAPKLSIHGQGTLKRGHGSGRLTLRAEEPVSAFQRLAQRVREEPSTVDSARTPLRGSASCTDCRPSLSSARPKPAGSSGDTPLSVCSTRGSLCIGNADSEGGLVHEIGPPRWIHRNFAQQGRSGLGFGRYSAFLAPMSAMWPIFGVTDAIRPTASRLEDRPRGHIQTEPRPSPSPESAPLRGQSRLIQLRAGRGRLS